MTEPQTTPRRGRRARALSPEEQAALEARSAIEADGEHPAAPGMRGAVAAPTADAPVPSLRKFGRRARIIELSEHDASAADAAAPTAEGGSAATITRDRDGVELGELSVTEAPEPRPAPRFDGKVLHRPENSRGRLLSWLVWALIAIALVVLVVLLLTGVLGGDSASAALTSLFDPSFYPSLAHPVLEETTA